MNYDKRKDFDFTAYRDPAPVTWRRIQRPFFSTLDIAAFIAAATMALGPLVMAACRGFFQ